MNTKKVSILLVSVLFLFSCAVFDPITARHLEGTWYLNGERDKHTEIVSTRDGLEARNETGGTSRLEYDRFGSVRALDWEGGLRGDIRGDRILWANGTTWTRVPR
jgi:hypothetical protein